MFEEKALLARFLLQSASTQQVYSVLTEAVAVEVWE